MKKRNVKYIWIGGVATNEDFEEMVKKGNNQVAANVTQLNFITGIEEHVSSAFKIISSHFQPSYPKYKELYVKKRIWERKNVKNIDVSFLNVSLIKRFFKKKNIKKEIKKIISASKDTDEYVFFTYALTTPIVYIIPYIKKKLGKRCKIISIVPDLPEFMNFGPQNIVKKILKKIDYIFIKRGIRKTDLFVLFAENMKNKLQINNYVVIEGLIDNDSIHNDLKVTEKKNIIMYAGMLNEEYGIMNLVEAFSKLQTNDYELHLYGVGNAISKINEYCIKNPKIKYMGLVEHEIILEKEREAKLLVNPRPNNLEYTKFSFPSKILEYMLSGTPVLTTELEAIPDEYYNHLYHISNNSVEKLKDKLEYILSLDNNELLKFGIAAKKFVIDEKNNIKQTKKIIDKL